MYPEDIINTIKLGGIGIFPTDTLYGLVGRADRVDTVERIYTTRRRAPHKPCIILLSDVDDLEQFPIIDSEKDRKYIERLHLWPGGVSIVLRVHDTEDLQHLTRGTGTLAFRVPDNPALQKVLRDIGPLIAPSANFEGLPSANTIDEARNYFGDTVDFYLDHGELSGPASTLIAMHDEHITILREGAVSLVDRI